MNDMCKAMLEKHGLTVKATFVPFSQSRNAGEKQPTLNWRVLLYKGDKVILSADYSAGCAHCPAYKLSVREAGSQNSIMRAEMIRYECENGKAYGKFLPGKPILPDPCDVFYSFLSDGEAIDAGSFESWAADYGYDKDSRKAFAMYNECIQTGLSLRSALGEVALSELFDAFSEY
jgi:hypothetical protein